MDPETTGVADEGAEAPRRNGLFWLGLVAVVAILVAATAFVASRDDEPATAAPSTTIPRLVTR